MSAGGGLVCLGSSSAGNGYVITAGEDRLIVELGLKWDSYLKALDYATEKTAVLITHQHHDHANNDTLRKAVQSFLPVYSGSRVDGTTFLTPRKRYKIGGFSVMPLPVEHGGCENVAYVIDHEGMGRVLFITDAESFPYKIDGVEHLLVECNYSNEIRFNRQLDGDSVRSNSEAHMELETTLDVVRRHYSEKLASVVLLHLSAKLSDEKAFKQAVEGICPLVDVYVAQGGLKIDFDVF